MRRATAALLGTIAGTALLVGAKYAQPSVDTSDEMAASEPDVTAEASLSADPSLSVDPSASMAAEVPAATTTEPEATTTTTTKPAATATTTSCSTATGKAASIVSPGTGTVTVTIKVCGGAVTSSSGSVANGNWDANTPAIAQLNTQVVQYYKSDLAKATYSGATLTSNSYKESFQSAMSKAGL